MKNQVQQENLILQKIKKKMDRIKATQQKLLQPLEEPPSHQRGKHFFFQPAFLPSNQNNNKFVFFFIIYKIICDFFFLGFFFLFLWFRKSVFFL